MASASGAPGARGPARPPSGPTSLNWGLLDPHCSGPPSRLFLTRRLWQQPQYKLNGVGQLVRNISQTTQFPPGRGACVSLPPALWGLQGAAGSRATARRGRAGLEGQPASTVGTAGCSWEPGRSQAGQSGPGGVAGRGGAGGGREQPAQGRAPRGKALGAVKDGKWNTPPEPTKAVCALKKKKSPTQSQIKGKPARAGF